MARKSFATSNPEVLKKIAAQDRKDYGPLAKWAIEHHGYPKLTPQQLAGEVGYEWPANGANPFGFCDEGWEVFQTIVKLEDKGKSPLEIFRLMKAKAPDSLEYIYNEIGDPSDRDKDELYAIEDHATLDFEAYKNFSPEFVAACKLFERSLAKEQARLEDFFDEDVEPKFVVKRGKLDIFWD